MNSLAAVRLEDDGRVPRVLVVRPLVVERERREDDSNADLIAAVDLYLWLVAVREIEEEFPSRRLDRLFLERNCRVPEPRRELQRVDPVLVDDTVDVDAPDVAFIGEPVFDFPEGFFEEFVLARPEHRSPHLAGRGTDVSRE